LPDATSLLHDPHERGLEDLFGIMRTADTGFQEVKKSLVIRQEKCSGIAGLHNMVVETRHLDSPEVAAFLPSDTPSVFYAE
jgi:hypothetical protein